MSAHLLPVTAAWLARLPDGVAVMAGVTVYRLHRPPSMIRMLVAPHGTSQIERQDLAFVMVDTVTAAAVAARIVWPWLSADREHRAAHRDVEHVIRAAERMQPLTPADLDTLTRLARAAMEGA